MWLAYGNQSHLVTRTAKLYKKYEMDIEEATDKSLLWWLIFLFTIMKGLLTLSNSNSLFQILLQKLRLNHKRGPSEINNRTVLWGLLSSEASYGSRESFFFFLIYLFLFLAALGLCCCTRAFL